MSQQQPNRSLNNTTLFGANISAIGTTTSGRGNIGGGLGGDDPLAFDSPIVQDRFSRFSRLTESFHDRSKLSLSVLGTSNTTIGDGISSLNDSMGDENHPSQHLSSNTTVTLADILNVSTGDGNEYHYHSTHQPSAATPTYINNLRNQSQSHNINLNTSIQLCGDDNIINDGIELSGDVEQDQMGIFQHFFELNQRLSKPTETFALLNEFDQTCEDNLVVTSQMLQNKVRSSAESNYFRKFSTLVRLERNTWRLFNALYQDRLITQATHEPTLMGGCEADIQAMELEEDIRLRLSDRELVERAMERTPVLREMQIVIDWLESIYDEEPLDSVEFYSDGPYYWENTLHHLKVSTKRAQISGGGANSLNIDRIGRKLCTRMDPDAAIRTGEALHDLDKEDENRLFNYLFRLIRGGQLQRGKQIVERLGFWWLSAALDGWILHHDPNYGTTESRKNNNYEDGRFGGGGRQSPSTLASDSVAVVVGSIDDNNDNDDSFDDRNSVMADGVNDGATFKHLHPITGNPYRDLWKHTIWKCCKVDNVSVYERAVFAVFAGNRSMIMPLCGAWLDKLWAYYKCSLDVHLECLLNETNIPKPDKQARTNVELPDEYWENKLTPAEIFTELDALDQQHQHGLSKNFPFLSKKFAQQQQTPPTYYSSAASTVSTATTSTTTTQTSSTSSSSTLVEEHYHQMVIKFLILGEVDRLIEHIHEWCKMIAINRELRSSGKLTTTTAAASRFGASAVAAASSTLSSPSRSVHHHQNGTTPLTTTITRVDTVNVENNNPNFNNNSNSNNEEYIKVVEPNLLRFFAHTVIVCQNLGLITDAKHGEKCVDVLQTYVHFLIEHKLIELIAFYSLYLPQHLQVRTFATLLESIEDTTNRMLCLVVAKQSRLNLPAILATVVENVRDGNYSYQTRIHQASAASGDANQFKSTATPSSSLLLPSLRTTTTATTSLLTSVITEEDERKISSLDWLLIDPDSQHYMELLWQGNALIRHFLLERKLEQAKQTFDKLPKVIVTKAYEEWREAVDGGGGGGGLATAASGTVSAVCTLDFDNVMREYFCHLAFFEANDAFQTWHEYLYNSKPHEPLAPKSFGFIGAGSGGGIGGSGSNRSLAARVAYEQEYKQYQKELQLWHQHIKSVAECTIEKLQNFLCFPEGIWITINDFKLTDDLAQDERLNGGAAAGGGGGGGLSTSIVPVDDDNDSAVVDTEMMMAPQLVNDDNDDNNGDGINNHNFVTDNQLNPEVDDIEIGSIDLNPTEHNAVWQEQVTRKQADWQLRESQLDAMRRIYVPQFVLLLHSIYVNSNKPQESLRVADIVADEEHRLHSTFTREQMIEFLNKLREVSIQLLSNTPDPLGYVSNH